MSAYYNEIDAYAAEWLRNLIRAGLIAGGDVDTRSIVDVDPVDLIGYRQCHFFAGIGGWSRALRLAGWPDDKAVWTGSCPCQPFSSAGARRGFDDDRHLWPTWRNLIAERRPSVVFGEQSARASAWLALVRSELEEMGYAVGAMPIEAACAGAQQLRDRYWFVACADDEDELTLSLNAEMADAPSTAVGVDREGLEVEFSGQARQLSPAVGTHSWPYQSAVGCVAYGIPARVGRLRAYGNAIVPQLAAEVIAAFMEVAP